MSLFDYYYLFELIYSSILVNLFPNELLIIVAFVTCEVRKLTKKNNVNQIGINLLVTPGLTRCVDIKKEECKHHTIATKERDMCWKIVC